MKLYNKSGKFLFRPKLEFVCIILYSLYLAVLEIQHVEKVERDVDDIIEIYITICLDMLLLWAAVSSKIS